MSQKKILEPHKLFDARAINGAEIFESDVTSVKYLDKVEITVNSTGSPVGTIQLLKSQQFQDGTFGPWTPVDFFDSITFVNVPHSLELNEVPQNCLKLSVNVTSGTGTITAIISGK